MEKAAPKHSAARHGTAPTSLDPTERTVLRTTRALLRDRTLDDAGYAAAVEALGERGLFELTTLVGYYALLALQLRVFAAD